MYIHLGNEISISDREIIGIFDIENTSISKDTRNYLKQATDDHRVVNVSLEMPKSFVVCTTKSGSEKTFISQISVSTLRKRAGIKL
ncbi:MAG: DUF370 domain-containing protein [Oscillospiraceae bacterium]|nr:DUF370 domain-containing protein [Oscillospiraceae bacterium]